jgi:hypothetical protein
MYMITDLPAVQPRYEWMEAGPGAGLPAGMARLDAAGHQTALDGDRLFTGRAWLDSGWVAVASVYRMHLSGPPVQSIYRIAEVAVRVDDADSNAAAIVVGRCIARAARNGGRALWCWAPIETVAFWQRCGFSIAGPAAAHRAGGAQVPVVHNVRSVKLRVL